MSALAPLFGAIAVGLSVIAYAAFRGGSPVIAVAALVLALWIGSLALASARRPRR